jgi:hypothetical protein
VVFTIAVLATGVAAAVAEPHTRWLTAHKATFIVWFAMMTVHVLAHVFDTLRLARADWSPATRGSASRAGVRIGLLAAALAAGVFLGVATHHWSSNWTGARGEANPSGSSVDRRTSFPDLGPPWQLSQAPSRLLG